MTPALDFDEAERDAGEAFRVWQEANRDAERKWSTYHALRLRTAAMHRAARRATTRIPETCTDVPPVSWPVDAERRRR